MAGINGDILRTALGFLGLSNIHATTDTPSAKFQIAFDRYGQHIEIDLTGQEILNALTGSDSESASTSEIDLNESAGG